MSRTLRRILAGTIVAAALTAMATPANAACYRFIDPVTGRIYYVCV